MTSTRKIKQRTKGRLAQLNARKEGAYNQNDVLMERMVPIVETAAAEAVQESMQNATPATGGVASPVPNAAAVKLHKESIDVDEKLIAAVEALTKSMDYAANEGKSKSGFGAYIQNKKESFKQLFTLPGLAQAAGIGQDPNTLIGSIFAGMQEKREQTEAAAREKLDYVTNFSTLTDVGRGMSRVEAVAEGSRRFEELKKLTPELESLEAKEKRAAEFGGTLDESDRARKEALLEKRKQLQTYSTVQKEEAVPEKSDLPKEKQQLLDDVKRGILDELSEMSPEEKNAFLKADPELLKDMFKGAFEELVELNDEQVKQLMEMNNKLSISEEAAFEANRRSLEPNLQSTMQQTTEKVATPEKGGSILDTIKDGAKDLLGKGRIGSVLKKAGGVGKGLMRFAPQLLRAAGPAAAVAGAGYAGWKVGGWLNDNVINPATEKLTGVKGQTLGGAIYDLLNPTQEDAPKPVDASRQVQTKRLKENEAKVEENKARKEAEATKTEAPIINSPTTTVNNNSTVVMPKPIRNNEPTFNKRLERYFA